MQRGRNPFSFSLFLFLPLFTSSNFSCGPKREREQPEAIEEEEDCLRLRLGIHQFTSEQVFFVCLLAWPLLNFFSLWSLSTSGWVVGPYLRRRWGERGRVGPISQGEESLLSPTQKSKKGEMSTKNGHSTQRRRGKNAAFLRKQKVTSFRLCPISIFLFYLWPLRRSIKSDFLCPSDRLSHFPGRSLSRCCPWNALFFPLTCVQ